MSLSKLQSRMKAHPEVDDAEPQTAFRFICAEDQRSFRPGVLPSAVSIKHTRSRIGMRIPELP